MVCIDVYRGMYTLSIRVNTYHDTYHYVRSTFSDLSNHESACWLSSWARTCSDSHARQLPTVRDLHPTPGLSILRAATHTAARGLLSLRPYWHVQVCIVRIHMYLYVSVKKYVQIHTTVHTHTYATSSPTGLNRTKIRAITYQIHTHTYQYIPKYIPIRVRFAPHKRVPGPYVWVCTVVCIGMYCVFMLVCICTYVLI